MVPAVSCALRVAFERIRHEITNGLGFVVTVDRYTRDELLPQAIRPDGLLAASICSSVASR